MLLELLFFFLQKFRLTHRNNLLRRYTVKYFKTNVQNIVRPSIKNFPKSAVYYTIIFKLLNCSAPADCLKLKLRHCTQPTNIFIQQYMLEIIQYNVRSNTINLTKLSYSITIIVLI